MITKELALGSINEFILSYLKRKDKDYVVFIPLMKSLLLMFINVVFDNEEAIETRERFNKKSSISRDSFAQVCIEEQLEESITQLMLRIMMEFHFFLLMKFFNDSQGNTNEKIFLS